MALWTNAESEQSTKKHFPTHSQICPEDGKINKISMFKLFQRNKLLLARGLLFKKKSKNRL